jgi:dihydroorotate dehydrogenase electron transfer subunit
MPQDRTLHVESNRSLGASYWLLTLDGAAGLPSWSPGQFAMLSLGAKFDPLLRRPFSIYNLCDPEPGQRTLQFLYKVMGRGSRILSALGPGDPIPCLFPLGQGFAPPIDRDTSLVLVAGGVGVASLHPLAAAERRAGRRPVLLYGCRTASEISGAQPTADLGIEMLVSTDDGSAGRRGFVSEVLDTFLAERGAAGRIVCACGPTPMMKATAAVAAGHGVRCYLSLESTMACGFGVCVGCVVGVRGDAEAPIHYKRTCVDGPVMDAAEILW